MLLFPPLTSSSFLFPFSVLKAELFIFSMLVSSPKKSQSLTLFPGKLVWLFSELAARCWEFQSLGRNVAWENNLCRKKVIEMKKSFHQRGTSHSMSYDTLQWQTSSMGSYSWLQHSEWEEAFRFWFLISVSKQLTKTYPQGETVIASSVFSECEGSLEKWDM